MEKRSVAMVVSRNKEDPTPTHDFNLIDQEHGTNNNKNKNSDSNNYENNSDKNNDNNSENERDEMEEDEEEIQEEAAMAIGNVIRVSGKGRYKKEHYTSFKYNGLTYELDDPILINSGEFQRPHVALIKDIYHQINDTRLIVTGQWFYRPEEAVKEGGGIWQSSHYRELYYTFHRDDFPAESVIHKCVVHFIPLTKHIPDRKHHPGFIVQKIYGTKEKRLFELTDKDYKDDNQQEIDVLLNATMARIGVLHDVEH